MLIFFDLDGTIIDISPRWWALHRDLTKKYSLPCHKYNSYIKFKKDGISERSIMEKISVDKDNIARYCHERLSAIECKKYLRRDKLFPFVKGLLKNGSRRHHLVLLTNRRSRGNLLWELRRLGLGGQFLEIMCTAGKTKEDILKNSKHQNNLRKSIFISDAYEDYLLAKKFKQRFFISVYGCRSRAYFRRKKIKRNLIYNPRGLKRLLCES